ncbi:MAG: murein transglycosylase A [Buchnera aphidicola (Meitanaphis elongallis)]
MNNKLVTILLLAILSFCSSKKNNFEISYDVDTKNNSNNELLNKYSLLNINNKIVNKKDLLIQIKKIKQFSPKLYKKNKKLYQSINVWLKSDGNITKLKLFGIHLHRLKNLNHYGNIKITSYYTPIIHARKKLEKEFRYPIYTVPDYLSKRKRLPSRKEIYNGMLQKKYIIAYSNSLIDNFIMDIQGSGIINYGTHKPLVVFKYAGENGWPYTSIGKILINHGDIKKENMSMQAIKNWSKRHTQLEVKKLLENNNSFVFFKPMKYKLICGANSIPLIAKTSIAADKNIIKPGSIVLAKIPILNKIGKFTNAYETRLLVALDVGGSIKGQKLDLYQGIGEKSGIMAGFYNHYGYIWILK